MSTSIDAHQLSTLLRLSSELDIVGDLTATVANPSDLLAWAHALPEPSICAWRAEDSGNRYVHVTAACHRNPVHGRVTAILTGDDHRSFWVALLPEGDLAAGEERLLSLSALATAWSALALEPSAENTPEPLAPPETDSRDAT
ncbi:MAG: hypothetical protein JO063_15450 [Pseudonocardiales bacterium]|nr:hypothetical protein [Pseudonocardiales bacterium]MBV9029220.1 hypothetical protein [Pseudonocardiales bacterium]MBW0011481.1 hypothetical protein [Pseudonocardiales bacterium]